MQGCDGVDAKSRAAAVAINLVQTSTIDRKLAWMRSSTRNAWCLRTNVAGELLKASLTNFDSRSCPHFGGVLIVDSPGRRAVSGRFTFAPSGAFNFRGQLKSIIYSSIVE